MSNEEPRIVRLNELAFKVAGGVSTLEERIEFWTLWQECHISLESIGALSRHFRPTRTLLRQRKRHAFLDDLPGADAALTGLTLNDPHKAA